jgi:hypothetical protein
VPVKSSAAPKVVPLTVVDTAKSVGELQFSPVLIEQVTPSPE